MNKNAESSMQSIVDKTNELQTYPKQPSEHWLSVRNEASFLFFC